MRLKSPSHALLLSVFQNVGPHVSIAEKLTEIPVDATVLTDTWDQTAAVGLGSRGDFLIEEVGNPYSNDDSRTYKRDFQGYEGYQYSYFWTGAYRIPAFRARKKRCPILFSWMTVFC